MNAPARARGAAVKVKVPPPLLYGLSLAAALAVHQWVLPLPLSLPGLTYAGIVVVVAGLGLGLSGVVTVLVHRTTLVPHRPVSRLVVAGPYRVSRNPMYTGLSVALAGAGLWAGSWWPLIVAPCACWPPTGGSSAPRRPTCSTASAPTTSATEPRCGAGSDRHRNHRWAAQYQAQRIIDAIAAGRILFTNTAPGRMIVAPPAT